MKTYIPLSAEQIAKLEVQSCRCEDWNNVFVDPEFDPEYVRNVTFSGQIKLGAFRKVFTLAGGIQKHSGIFHATLHNVVVGDDCMIEHVRNYIANYVIGNGSYLENVTDIITYGDTTFGNGIKVNVLNETGGREVAIHDNLSSHEAYISALYRHKPALTEALDAMVAKYVERVAVPFGVIGENVGHGYSASESLFFSNCQGENGEACSLFAGPYTVTHHKSTLLIAGMFSFMNAGSGSNQSNHMYKLGPIHQGILERGAKTTSDSYILWPAKIGAFSLVMGRHVNNLDTTDLPFSYLIEQQGSTYIVPGVNLKSVGTIRDVKKWPERDKRKDPHRLDYINFNHLSPYTVQKMFAGIEILERLKEASGHRADNYCYKKATIRNAALFKGIKYYQTAIVKFLGNSLISRMQNADISTDEGLRRALRKDTSVGMGQWVDISGLIAPASEIERICNDVIDKTIDDVTVLSERFRHRTLLENRPFHHNPKRGRRHRETMEKRRRLSG